MYLHMQTRPGTENDDFDELMQTYVYTPSSPQTTSPSAKKDTPPEPDPETSLITDFQIVTDIRVNSCMLKLMDTYMYTLIRNAQTWPLSTHYF